MPRASLYHAAADLVLLTHVAFVAFVVGGLILIVIGGCRSWNWIRNPWFRILHIAGIGLVVAQAWLGLNCPLTTLELGLRERAGDATYDGAFIAHWLQIVLYCQAPAWVFVVCYTTFGLAVAGSWLRFRPHSFGKRMTTPDHQSGAKSQGGPKD
jgi:hypothetical protein